MVGYVVAGWVVVTGGCVVVTVVAGGVVTGSVDSIVDEVTEAVFEAGGGTGTSWEDSTGGVMTLVLLTGLLLAAPNFTARTAAITSATAATPVTLMSTDDRPYQCVCWDASSEWASGRSVSAVTLAPVSP